jgi:acrylyl-CoA reductase (NADPH)
MTFLAAYLDNTSGFSASLTQLPLQALKEGQVRIALAYSSLNYKDALALTNHAPVVRTWPMVAGIDGVGTVIESLHPAWLKGDQVISQGLGMGETIWGGLAQQVCVSGDRLIELPAQITPYEAMALGTAGFTAILCVLALEEHGILPDSGQILVTGASGGVGSLAITLLAKLGYQVIASTGKIEAVDFLYRLGAKEIINRDLLATANPKALQSTRWIGVIDTVGSYTLANALAQTAYGGVVLACGLAQGIDLPTSVAPFIFRKIRLLGIDSVHVPIPLREQAWARLAQDFPLRQLLTIAREIPLRDIFTVSKQLIAGKIRGRIVVDIND